MKILWFTNSAYSANDVIKQNPATGTWLIALAQAFALLKDIELHIVFYSQKDIIPFKHNGIHYHPIFREGTENKLGRIIYRIKQLYSKSTELIEIEKCKKAIEEIKPDIIHVHGTEENYGLACIGTKYPYVISIQGLISSVKYKLFAGFTKEQIKSHEPLLHKIMFSGIASIEKRLTMNAKREQKILENCNHIIGRTKWDYDCTLAINPQRKYYISNELMREDFHKNIWTPLGENNKIHIATIISNGIYKGVETIYQAAHQLKKVCINIEWNIIGLCQTDNIIKTTEKVLGYGHKDININLCGRKCATEIIDILKRSDIYVQASHIENSPNNICEAMLLGMPIIATMAGGTSSILKDREEGYLIQDGDPYSMSGAIIHCIENYDEAIDFGKAARKTAKIRHDSNFVSSNIIEIYNTVITQNK